MSSVGGTASVGRIIMYWPVCLVVKAALFAGIVVAAVVGYRAVVDRKDSPPKAEKRAPAPA